LGENHSAPPASLAGIYESCFLGETGRKSGLEGEKSKGENGTRGERKEGQRMDVKPPIHIYGYTTVRIAPESTF